MQTITLMVLAIFLTACTHNVPKKQVYISSQPTIRPIEVSAEPISCYYSNYSSSPHLWN